MYNNILYRKQGPYKVPGATDNTLQIFQDGLENIIFIYWTTISPTSKRHCDDDPADRNKHSGTEEPHSDGETDKHWEEVDITYVFDKIVGYIGYGSGLSYVMGWYGHSRTDDTAEHSPHYIPQHVIDTYWRRRDKQKRRRRPSWKPLKEYYHTYHFSFSNQRQEDGNVHPAHGFGRCYQKPRSLAQNVRIPSQYTSAQQRSRGPALLVTS